MDLGGFLLQFSGIFRQNFIPKAVQKAAGERCDEFPPNFVQIRPRETEKTSKEVFWDDHNIVPARN